MTSFIHDIIKIKFVSEGYLPNYPPHLISDNEMCDAFLNYPQDDTKTEDELWEMFQEDTTPSWFKDKFPLETDLLLPQYKELVKNIAWHLSEFKSSLNDENVLPDWIYSYMNGSVISVSSTIPDIHDLLVLLGVDNLDDIFTPEAQLACYVVSKEWLAKTPSVLMKHRSPTVFGEPHVIKSLRLDELNMLDKYWDDTYEKARKQKRDAILAELKAAQGE